MILLLVTIGLLNIGLGFGLAMYYGLGPPGLDGIFEALGPMPPVIPSVPPHDSSGMERSPDPAVAPDSTAEPATNLPADNSIARPGDALPEEDVLGDVQDLAATAQTAMESSQVQSPE